MKENLKSFYGISVDNPPKKYKGIIDRAMTAPNLDENGYPKYAYFDEKEEETEDKEFQEEFDEAYEEIESQETDEDTDNEAFDDE